MKLSEIKGDRALDVIADIIDPICNIAEDEEAMALFERQKCPDGVTPRQFAAQRIRKSVPVLLRNHKSDVIVIVATLTGVSPYEYAKELTIPQLVNDLADVFVDDLSRSLFISAQSATTPGSAQESIEGRDR